jgi:hypothetical protein
MPISSGPYSLLTQMQSFNVDAQAYYVGSDKVVGEQQTFIADPTGGATVDVQGRAAVNSILDLLSEHGLMAAS